MLIQHVALVSETELTDMGELCRGAAALQKQVMRDFAPVWEVSATVDAFAALEDVPVGYWPIIVMDDIGYPGAAGIHLDEDGQPFSLVQATSGWELTASHEVLEMLADPFGNRLIAGNSIKAGQGRVEYLVEVCDPSEGEEFGYTVNGITLSDFYTPRFFDPVTSSGVQYSFTGAVQEPRQIRKGGYLSWMDPTTEIWWQQTWFAGPKPAFRELGKFQNVEESLRAEVDKRTFRPQRAKGVSKMTAKLFAANTAMVAKSASAKAGRWRAQIASVQDRYRPDSE